MKSVRRFLRENPGRWQLAAAVFALAALLPEYLMPVFCVAAYACILRRGKAPLSLPEKIALTLYGWMFVGVLYSHARVSAVSILFLWGFFLLGSRMMQQSVDSAARLDAVIFCGALGGGAAGGIGILQMLLFHYGGRVAKPLETCLNPFWHMLDMHVADLAVRIWPKNMLSVLQRTQFIAIRDRASGTFTNPIFFAVFLCMMLPLCAYGVFYGDSRKKRVISLVCLGLAIGGVACSYSRGPYLAVAVVFVVLLFYGRRYAWRLAVAGAVVLAGLSVSARGVFRRLLTLFHAEDISVSTHANIWRACFQMLRGHWLFGYGTGVGNVRNMLHEIYHIQQPHAHNLILEFLLENGVVGAALFLAMLAVAAVQLLRLTRQGGRARGAAVTLLASLAAFCACGMSDYLFYGLKPICYFWMAMGLASCAARIYAQPADVKTDASGDAAHETASVGERL
ncbi:MAG: O-antigen ligase family protein [Clostridia bacterium]|nr:O-antigen ligase family protein [Clostridia bacterium]